MKKISKLIFKVYEKLEHFNPKLWVEEHDEIKTAANMSLSNSYIYYPHLHCMHIGFKNPCSNLLASRFPRYRDKRISQKSMVFDSQLLKFLSNDSSDISRLIVKPAKNFPIFRRQVHSLWKWDFIFLATVTGLVVVVN